MTSKGISYGSITAQPDGKLDVSRVEGVDADLRVRPFFAHGGTTSIREFIIGALNNEMGLQALDPEVTSAAGGWQCVTPAGMALNGKLESWRSLPTPIQHEFHRVRRPATRSQHAVVDYLEFYLLNYFKPALYEQTDQRQRDAPPLTESDAPLAISRTCRSIETAGSPTSTLSSIPKRATSTDCSRPQGLSLKTVEDGTGLPPLKSPPCSRSW